MELVKLTSKEFARIAKTVYDRAGIYLPEEKLSLLSNRLRKRLRALNLQTFKEYETVLADAERGEEELPFFLSAVTTNETYFFRNDKLWQFFTTDLIRCFVESKQGKARSINIWSAAASSGEEAYTAAIALAEGLPDWRSWRISIVGTDISKRVLDQARNALYDEYAVHKLSKTQLKRWFEKKDEKFQLSDEIRKLVTFQFHNLRDPFPGRRFDLAFLRNVLMYFDTPMKKKVIAAVSGGLAPGGYLIVGDVDPIRTIPELNHSMTCTYQRPGVYRKPGGSKVGATDVPVKSK